MAEPMNLAYLVLAHHQPQHLARLIRTLNSPGTRFFVHLDGRAPMRDFTSIAGRNVSFCDRRTRIHWGEFSIVQATLDLMGFAMAAAPLHDRFVLLSGADYPLRSNEYIQNYLAQHPEAEFMNLVTVPDERVGKSLERVTTHRVLAASGPVGRRIRKAASAVGIPVDRQRDFRKYLDPLTPCAGSMWWALSRDACAHILNFARSETRVMRFFHGTVIPDELVFQTILGNSPFRENVRRNLTYTDWSGGGVHPSYIDESHVSYFEGCDRVTAAGVYGEGEMLFARKFREGSGALLDRMDAMIRRKDA